MKTLKINIEKLKIVHDYLCRYLKDWDAKTNSFNYFYYATKRQRSALAWLISGGDIKELDKEDKTFVSNVLEADRIKYGRHEYLF